MVLCKIVMGVFIYLFIFYRVFLHVIISQYLLQIVLNIRTLVILHLQESLTKGFFELKT